MSRQYDAIIIGAGIAGMTCALEWLAPDKKILMLDRDVQANFGGLAKESFGGLLMVDTPLQRRARVFDSPEIAWRDWKSFGHFCDDDTVDTQPKAWAQHYIQDSRQWLYDWLLSLGVSFLPMPMWVERGLFGDGNSIPRWHITWGTGKGLTDAIGAALARHPQRGNLEILFEHRVEGLVVTNGKVTGCRGVLEHDGSKFEFHAPVVVIAAGGINGCLNMVREHWHAEWGSAPQTLLNGSHKYADGTLHRAAQAVGANITHLDKQWNYAAGVHHWQPRKPLHGLSLVPPKSALWVNAHGRRIGPMPLVSGYDTRDLVTQICHQPGGYSWQILNRKIALKELAVSGSEFNPSFREKSRLAVARDILLGNHWLYDTMTANCPDFVLAHSVGELADKMNALNGDNAVDGALLEEEIAHYDAEIARGQAQFNDEQLRRITHLRQWRGDKMRICKFQKIVDAKAMPLLAIREFIVSRKSLGGIQTDLSCRVLTPEGNPIDGLYAIGEAAGFGGGGMNGLRGLEGTFLGGSMYSARRLGRLVAL